MLGLCVNESCSEHRFSILIPCIKTSMAVNIPSALCTLTEAWKTHFQCVLALDPYQWNNFDFFEGRVYIIQASQHARLNFIFLQCFWFCFSTNEMCTYTVSSCSLLSAWGWAWWPYWPAMLLFPWRSRGSWRQDWMIWAPDMTSQLLHRMGMSPVSKYMCSETNDQSPLIQQGKQVKPALASSFHVLSCRVTQE